MFSWCDAKFFSCWQWRFWSDCGCAYLFESSLGAHVRRYFFTLRLRYMLEWKLHRRLFRMFSAYTTSKHSFFQRYENCVTPQQAHNIKMTSYQRRYDVITSHRRWYDVILTLCAYWLRFNGHKNRKKMYRHKVLISINGVKVKFILFSMQ